MKELISPGSDALLAMVARQLNRGEITQEQYDECHRRAIKNPTKTIIELEE